MRWISKLSKVLWFTIVSILLVAASVGIWLATHYKSIIRSKLPSIAAKMTDSLYQIHAGDVAIDFRTRDVVITDLVLTPDRAHIAKLQKDYKLPSLLFDVRIARVYIKHLSFRSFIEEHILEAELLKISKPIARISKIARPTIDKDTSQKESSLKKIKIGLIEIDNPDMRYTDMTAAGRTGYEFKGGNIVLNDWLFDLNGDNDTTRLFYSSRVRFSLQSFRLNDKKGDYTFRVSGINFDNQKSDLEINGLALHPAISRAAFYKRTGYQKEIYDVSLPIIRLNGLDWRKLIYNKSLFAANGLISNGHIDIYMDRVPPPNLQSKNGKFPHQILLSLPIPVYIPEIEIRKGSFAYTERNEKTMRAGTLSMNQISGRIQNITNIPALIKKRHELTIKLNGAFKASPIQAYFQFPLNTKSGAYSVSGTLAAIDGTKLNDLLVPLALAEFRTMQVDKIDFDIQGDEIGAKGSIIMLYHDLKLKLLELEAKRRLDKKDVTSFLANNLLIYPANPMPGKGIRHVTPVVYRDSTKSFFNVIWKCLFTGTLQTVGRVNFLDDAVNKKAKKQDEKRKAERK